MIFLVNFCDKFCYNSSKIITNITYTSILLFFISCLLFYIQQNIQIPLKSNIHTQPQTYTDAFTHRPRHTNIDKDRHTQTSTCRHKHTQTRTCRHIHGCRHTIQKTKTTHDKNYIIFSNMFVPDSNVFRFLYVLLDFCVQND